MNQSAKDPTNRTATVDELINSLCATVPDYPKPGISFKDLTPVFADGAAFSTATLELHTTDLAAGSRVLILDDVLAAGGTLGAAVRLFERCGVQVAGVGAVLHV